MNEVKKNVMPFPLSILCIEVEAKAPLSTLWSGVGGEGHHAPQAGWLLFE